MVTVALALTKESRKETVSVTAEEEIKVEDNSESNTASLKILEKLLRKQW